MDFKDPQVFSGRPISSLLFSLVILKSSGFSSLLKLSTYLTRPLMISPFAFPVRWVLEKTYYAQFVAGNDLQSSSDAINELGKCGIYSIMDYSIESIDCNIDNVVETLANTIRKCSKNQYTHYSCFKVTSLASVHILTRMSQLLRYQVENPSFYLNWKDMLLEESGVPMKDIVNALADSAPPGGLIAPTFESRSMHLTVTEMKELASVVARMEYLASTARDCDFPVLVDAEQYSIQGAINFLTKCIMKKYNKNKTYIYNTYQMYLKSSMNSLEADCHEAEKNQYYFGAKLVRGAYIESETALAHMNNTESPIFDSINETHNSYSSSLRFMLPRVKNRSGELIIATHNMDSIIYSTNLLANENMRLDSVTFAQLYGMCDHLSLTLASSGHRVCKYVPFGPIEDVIPYLVRRIQENKSVLGSTGLEQNLLLKEIASRLKLRITPQFNRLGA